MKRRVTQRRYGPRAHDIKKELSREQLAALGAVALAWNDVEAMIDVLLCVVMSTPHKLWRELTTRINGIEGKFSIIKTCIKDRFGINGGLFDDIVDTLSAAAQYRGYRDTIVHSRVVDTKNSIAEMRFRRDKQEEVLLTADALNNLYDRLLCIRDEAMHLISFFEALEDRRALLPDGTMVEWLAMERWHARHSCNERR